MIDPMKLVIGIFLAAGIVAAQSSEWSNVKHLAKGEEIRVFLVGSNGSDGKSYRGQLSEATDESLIMIAASSQETLARAQIKKISIKKPSHRGRNALIGLGIGAAGGLAIGAAADAEEGFLSIGKQVFTPVGAIIGTVVGVAWPTGGWKDVYRAK
jgi:hypothetical protein